MIPSLCSRTFSAARSRRVGQTLFSFALLFVSGCNELADDVFCSDRGCDFGAKEWSRIAALGPLPEAPADPSNKYANNPLAVSLGHRLYYDTRLSGRATLQDTLGRPIHEARAPLNQF